MRANVALLAAVLLAPVSAPAHHSFAAVFDSSQTLTLDGEVTKVEWTNPHIWVYLDVVDDQGEVVNWQCEGGTPNSLRRRGWSSDTLQPGDQVEIQGWRAHDGSETCNARVMIKDGRRLFAGSSYVEQ